MLFLLLESLLIEIPFLDQQNRERQRRINQEASLPGRIRLQSAWKEA